MKKFEEQPNSEDQSEAFNVISRWEFETGDRRYDVKKIIELAKDLPVSEVSPEKLAAMKDGEYWRDEQGNRIHLQEIFDLYEQTGGNWQAMAEAKPDYRKHIQTIEESDYENDPIVIVGSPEDFKLIDGLHRLTRAWIDRVERVKAQRFDTLPKEAIISENQ